MDRRSIVGKNTSIAWCHHTFNPWWGCVKVSPACDHCYAEVMARRTGHAVWGADAPRRVFGESHWAAPLTWDRDATRRGRRARVFCASMADVFEARQELTGARQRLWDLVEATSMLDWLLLTKRPHQIRRCVPAAWLTTPPANVWYGTTVESPEYLWRLDALRDVPAVVRFVSYEPALADVIWPLTGMHWLIAGGESGAGCRPPDPAWIRSARDQAVAAGVKFFFKQWGGITAKRNGRVLDGREWNEVPGR
ncbi:MAG TPA: phage Gp37/Gp68 family protein, partial [Gemmatimonadales bacterium]|nr:phage Gp37/Gp68 family protein [Gemmatimonadales bacterium]